MGIELEVSAKALYSLSDHWGIYTGFNASVFRWNHDINYYYLDSNGTTTGDAVGSPKEYDVSDLVAFFRGASIILGVRYSF